MANSWYVQLMGREIGPLTDSQLRSLANEQRIKPHDQLRKSPTGTWVSAERVRGLFVAQAVVSDDGSRAISTAPQNPPTPPAPPLMTKALPSEVHERPKSHDVQKACPDCAEKIPFDAKACHYCGLSFVDRHQSPQMVACPGCKKQISRTAKACPHCGHSFPRPSRKIAVALAWTLGAFGVHKFYLDKTREGIISLLFFWTLIPAIAALIEGIIYLSLTDDEFADRYDPPSGRVPAATREQESESSIASDRLATVLGWFFGVMLCFYSLPLAANGLWPVGLILIAFGVLLLPPTWTLIGSRIGLARESAEKINRSKSYWTMGSVVFFLMLFIVTAVAPTLDDRPLSSNTRTTSNKWYEGGTLLDKTGREWQAAPYADKLATCGDMVASLWIENALKPSMQSSLDSVDELKQLAEKLVAFIDAEVTRNPSASANQPVRRLGALGVTRLGFVN